MVLVFISLMVSECELALGARTSPLHSLVCFFGSAATFQFGIVVVLLS